MHKVDMVKMLHALDAELKSPLEIIITGASALILNGFITRASNDIDILKTSDQLDEGFIGDVLNKIAARFHLSNTWLDIRPSEETFKDLPGYHPDVQKLDGNFKYLNPLIISKADSVLTKFARYTNIRQWDRGDIKATFFTDDDFLQVQRKLAALAVKDPERAMRIELEFKSIKPQFIKTDQGLPYTCSGEIARYAKTRYGIILDTNYLEQLDDDVANLITTYEKAIIDIDCRALSRLNENAG